MRCPYCGSFNDRVVNSRQAQGGDSIRRRRECLDCGHRFTTFEHVEQIPILVIKRDGKTRVPFDRQKIVSGILKACEKRAVAMADIEKIADHVEKTLQNNMEREVSSLRIGEMILKRLRSLDEVAYVRFASVYREFRDISDFSEEVRVLLEEE